MRRACVLFAAGYADSCKFKLSALYRAHLTRGIMPGGPFAALFDIPVMVLPFTPAEV